MVVQHHRGVGAEEEHHLQEPQAVEVAAVVHPVPPKQAPGEGEELRGHHGLEAEGAGGHRVLQSQAAEAVVEER